MVGRKCAESRSERRTSRIGELVGVQLYLQVCCACCLKNPSGLSRSEGDSFAKDVDSISQASLDDLWQHLVTDHVDVVVRTALVLTWHCVGTKKSCLYCARKDVSNSVDRTEHS
jgi:hypothetical protein